MLAVAGSSALAASLNDPVSFESTGGELNLIMAAVEAPIDFSNAKTMGWVYDVCRRAKASATSCLPGTSTRPYGGVWLKVKPNDTLRIRLVNKLPPVPDALHCDTDLVNNPTNLHTHGMIVEPHRSTGGSDPYGDYVFVEVQNRENHGSCATPAASARSNGRLPSASVHDHAAAGVHPDMDVGDGAVEYAIHLVNHPSGVFWFHPHMHGVALNQVTAGMSGVITVGEPLDGCVADADCIAAVKAGTTHLLMLKDSEVLADGTLKNQQESTFCLPTQAAGEAPRHAVCAGDANAGYGGGHWFHTINGQIYPDITVNSHGAIWHIVNSAGSRSYDLSLAPEGGGDAIPLQVLSIDGITIDANQFENLALQAQLGNKMEISRCPDVPGAGRDHAVCARHIRMMPSSRVSVRVLSDRADARKAVLYTDVYDTGPGGDKWPAIELASVTLAAPAPGVAYGLHVTGGAKSLMSASGVLGDVASVMQPGDARPVPLEQVQRTSTSAESSAPLPGMRMATAYAIDPALKLGLRKDPHCASLAPGEHRRIYLGSPNGADFGIATSVIDEDNTEKNLTALDEFNPTETKVCLTASRIKGRPTTETWEIVNLTNEDHNFHIHQTRFSLLSHGPSRPGRIDDVAVLQDNVPVPHATDASQCDGSLAPYASGACKPQSVWVSIPFTQIGDFVFHCHILEHEDGGMMARIRVVAPPAHEMRN
jgi:FtsP/CotA-like multicopper oxidase with cupredoxin domain